VKKLSDFRRGGWAIMGMQCAITGKKPVSGNKIRRRGKAKYLGGVGRKVTGITKRKFKPNLQRVKVEIDGTVKTIRVATSAIRSGLIQKPVKRKPFQMMNV
jgi:large subunit ribosomal protein L28